MLLYFFAMVTLDLTILFASIIYLLKLCTDKKIERMFNKDIKNKRSAELDGGE
jgi:hypothetical protein